MIEFIPSSGNVFHDLNIPDPDGHPLLLVQLLQAHGLATTEALAIKARRHPQFPNLVCFKYDQRLSPMSSRAVQEARGIILDEADDWTVVSMSFRKFFNLGEPQAATIDWETAVVEEKIDGSLMTLYWYAGAWRVQTSGTADAGGQVVSDIRTQGASTFAELFWQTFRSLGYALPDAEEEMALTVRDRFFAFELMTPQNQVVVAHVQPRLVLHGVRERLTLEEEDAGEWAAALGYEGVRVFPLTEESLVAAAEALPVGKAEGFVVRDRAYHRVKVKASAYVRIAMLLENWTPARAAAIVLAGEVGEVVAYLPRFREELEAIRGKLETAYSAIWEYHRAMLHAAPEQKAFAALALKTPYSAALFALRSHKAESPEAWLLSQTEPAQVRVLTQWGVI